jgi:hypothetical protein
MVQLADSDVWYISYDVRNDALFAYALFPNDSLKPPHHLPDLYAFYVELPDAPAESWTTPFPALAPAT